jgi:shikimate kinase|tara:strand:- start:116 stop:616 length:501 start_codon:yes stop_codon:yes gene_type:complete
MSTIAFIGFRGSGKSILGRWLANELDVPFIDTDDEVLTVLGYASVSEAWERIGERGWREAEMRVIPDLLEQEAVVSLGGGAPLLPNVAKAVAVCDVVFNLTASEKVTADRIASGSDRPALSADDTEMRLRRLPAYADLATCGIDTSGNIDLTKKCILDFLEGGRQI